jgi:hypothetical protein
MFGSANAGDTPAIATNTRALNPATLFRHMP